MHDPLILVHCRHTWSYSLGSPSMWEVRCGPSELCCQNSTHQKPNRHSTHSGSKSGKNHPQQEHQSPSASHPLMTWWENSLIDSLELASSQVNTNMTASRHSFSHTHTQKMPDCIMSQGQAAPSKNGSPGSNHPCRPAHRLGIIDYLCTKGK